MLKIILCDDNENTVNEYANRIRQCGEKNGIDLEIASFYSGESLLFHLAEAPLQADIIYLDILMGKTDGMETARKLRDSGCHAQIIFITSCEDYVYEAFDVDAVHYLLKDQMNPAKFERVFLRAAELAAKKEEELFVCEFDGVKKTVPVSRILYFEIWKRLITVYCDGDQTEKFYGSMEQLENRFANKNFVRVHRSYLVHLPYIAQFLSRSLILKNGAGIPVGVTYMRSLKSAFSEYISRFHIHDSGLVKE